METQIHKYSWQGKIDYHSGLMPSVVRDDYYYIHRAVLSSLLGCPSSTCCFENEGVGPEDSLLLGERSY